jgi:hypothetical protein
MEVHAHMEELLKDLGMFRRKVADDHERFGIKKPKQKSPPPRRTLSEVEVNF